MTMLMVTRSTPRTSGSLGVRGSKTTRNVREQADAFVILAYTIWSGTGVFGRDLAAVQKISSWRQGAGFAGVGWDVPGVLRGKLRAFAVGV